MYTLSMVDTLGPSMYTLSVVDTHGPSMYTLSMVDTHGPSMYTISMVDTHVHLCILYLQCEAFRSEQFENVPYS